MHRLLLSSLVLFAFGCTKYEQDGSLLHLRSPERRIVGTWSSVKVDQVGDSDDANVTELMTSNNLRLDAEFRDDHTVTISKIGEDLVYEGTWEFNEDNSVLHLDLVFNKALGPFYRDGAGTDYTDLVVSTAATLGQPDTLFFLTGSYTDVTNQVYTYLAELSTTTVAWTYNGGAPFFDYSPGDDITSYMPEFIDGLLAEGLITSATDYAGIIATMSTEYGVNVSYVEQPPVVSGPLDPALPGVLQAMYGLDVTLFVGTFATGTSDPDVWAYIADNDGPQLTEQYDGEVKRIDVYWRMLELDLDDMQVYQFREYAGEETYDYSYLLRFEKQ
jgi:hypothetical protein